MEIELKLEANTCKFGLLGPNNTYITLKKTY